MSSYHLCLSWLNNPFPGEFTEYAVDFGMARFEKLLIVDGVLTGRIGDVMNLVVVPVPEVFHKPEGFSFRRGILLNQSIFLPLLHNEDDIRRLYHFRGERLRAVAVEAESISAGDMLHYLMGRAASTSLDAGRANTHFLAGMGKVLLEIVFHVTVQISAARDVCSAGDNDRKFLSE